MALIKCPNCGKDISDRATACPKCGYVMHKSGDSEVRTVNEPAVPETVSSTLDVLETNNQSSKGRKNKTTIIGLVIAVAIVGIICICLFGKKNEDNHDSSAKSGITGEEYKELGEKKQENESLMKSDTSDVTKDEKDIGDGGEAESSNSTSSSGAKEVLIDQDGYYVEYRGIEEYDEDDYIINLYIENNTEEDLCYVFDQTAINGYNIQLSNSYIELPANSKNPGQ